MGHILAASIISIPAAIVVSVLMVPPTTAMTSGELAPPVITHQQHGRRRQGTEEGIKLLINIIAHRPASPLARAEWIVVGDAGQAEGARYPRG